MCYEAFRLLYVYLLLQLTIKECCLDIYLMDFPSHLCCKWDHSSYRSILGHRSKCLLIVYSLLLREPLGHEPCLVFLDATICTVLYLIDSTWSNYFSIYWSRHYLPHIILHNWVILLNHSFLPYLMLCNLLIDGRFTIYQLTNQYHIVIELGWLSLLSSTLSRSSHKLISIPLCMGKCTKLWC